MNTNPRRLHRASIRASTLVVWSCCLMVGCGSDGRSAGRGATDVRGKTSSSATEGEAMRNQLLAGAVAVLSAMDRYDEARGREQVFDRLVQWSHALGRFETRQPDTLLGTLSPDLQKVGDTIRSRETFDAVGDIAAVRDRCWLAAIARTARGDAVDDLAVAEALFRWTIRSLAPVSDPPMVPSEATPGNRWFLPGEILLSGRASSPQRAWIFIELLRQAGLDGVILATTGVGGEAPRPWLPAVIIAGEAYLFEPTYGLPVPGPGGVGVATLRQAAADPTVLAALALPERPYPVSAADAQGVGILVVADPWSLSDRMARLQPEIVAQHGIQVAVAPTPVADRASAALPGGPAASRGLWAFPWECLARRTLAAKSLADELGPLEIPIPRDPSSGASQFFKPLFAGRVREFRGDLDGPGGAKEAYMAARLSRRFIAGAAASLPEPQGAALTKQLVRVKEDATYWLGVVMLVEGQFAAAEDYFSRMTLKASPDSRWTDAARINLAEALVRLHRPAEAAAILKQDGSAQRFGSRLLANRLEASASAESRESPEREADVPKNPPQKQP